MVEIDPVKFTLDHPDDGSRPHYGVDKGDIAEDEQALCISMAIDLRDGYSHDMSMHDYNVQTLDSNQTISMVTAQQKAVNLENMVKTSLNQLNEEAFERLGIRKLGDEPLISAVQQNGFEAHPEMKDMSAEDLSKEFENFKHQFCRQARRKGTCNHLNEIYIFVMDRPSEKDFEGMIKESKLEDYEHIGCREYRKLGECKCLKNIIVNIRLAASGGPSDESQKKKAEEERIKAEVEARLKRELEEKERAEAEAKRKAEEEKKRKEEEKKKADIEKARKEAEARLKAEEEKAKKRKVAKRKAEEEAKKKAEAEAKEKQRRRQKRRQRADEKKKRETEAKRKDEKQTRKNRERQMKRKKKA